MNINPESERAALMVRASDAGMTPGEKAANEEADRRAYSNSAEVRATEKDWRHLAEKARQEDLRNGHRGQAIENSIEDKEKTNDHPGT